MFFSFFIYLHVSCIQITYYRPVPLSFWVWKKVIPGGLTVEGGKRRGVFPGIGNFWEYVLFLNQCVWSSTMVCAANFPVASLRFAEFYSRLLQWCVIRCLWVGLQWFEVQTYLSGKYGLPRIGKKSWTVFSSADSGRMEVVTTSWNCCVHFFTSRISEFVTSWMQWSAATDRLA